MAEKQAALAQAELNLRDAYVRAPVAGIIETRTVQTGQYVQPGTVLATLVRRDPLLLRFRCRRPRRRSLRAGHDGALHRARATPAATRRASPTSPAADASLAHGGGHRRGAGRRQGRACARAPSPR